jgi:hypothetical protein
VNIEFSYSRLSDAYQRKQTTRQRKKIYEAFLSRMDEIKDRELEVCFFTPTFPNLLGVGFEKNAAFQARAWELFLKNSFIREIFEGGYAKTEFTTGNKKQREKEGRRFSLELDGINYHCHALTILKKALAFDDSHELENRLLAMNKDQSLVAEDKRLIRRSLRVVKIWTRCLKVAHREVFQKFLRIKTKSGNAKVSFQKVNLSEIENHSDAKQKGILFELCGYAAKQADFMDLDPELLAEAEEVFRNKRIINPFGCFRSKPKTKTERNNNLDEQSDNLTDPLLNHQTYRKENEPNIKAKLLRYQTFKGDLKSLKKIGIGLCESGQREAWLKHLKNISDSLIALRRNRMLSRFPNAIFTDLEGNIFYGSEVRRTLEGH